MLTQSKDRRFLFEIPNNDVGVLTTLSRGQKLAVVADRKAGNGVIMCRQEVLIVRVLNVANHNTAANDE